MSRPIAAGRALPSCTSEIIPPHEDLVMETIARLPRLRPSLVGSPGLESGLQKGILLASDRKVTSAATLFTSPMQDSDLRPLPYQGSALPAELTGAVPGGDRNAATNPSASSETMPYPGTPARRRMSLPLTQQEDERRDHHSTLKQPRRTAPGIEGRLIHASPSLAGVGGQSGQRQTRPTSGTRTSADPRPQFGHRRASALRRAAVTELSVARLRLPS